MIFVPKCYYNSEIIKLVNDYISDGYKSFSSLDEIDQDKITAKCIEILGNDAYSCIIDSDDFHITMHHFKQYILKGDKEYALDLAETMRRNANQYFSSVMDSLFDEMNVNHEVEVNYLAGLKPVTDHINGEVRWI